jgi:hypothetical protein
VQLFLAALSLRCIYFLAVHTNDLDESTHPPPISFYREGDTLVSPRRKMAGQLAVFSDEDEGEFVLYLIGAVCLIAVFVCAVNCLYLQVTSVLSKLPAHNSLQFRPAGTLSKPVAFA